MNMWLFTYDPEPQPYEDWASNEFIMRGTRTEAYDTFRRLNERSKGLWNVKSIKHQAILVAGDALQYNAEIADRNDSAD